MLLTKCYTPLDKQQCIRYGYAFPTILENGVLKKEFGDSRKCMSACFVSDDCHSWSMEMDGGSCFHYEPKLPNQQPTNMAMVPSALVATAERKDCFFGETCD